MTRIMLVDDDKNCLKSLYRTLASSPSYEITMFNSAKEGICDAHTTEYDVIITDYRMPEMDGITFLKKIKQTLPNASRIIISGHCDKESLYCAINEAQAHRYIKKPCDPDAVRAIVSEVIREHKTNPATIKNSAQQGSI